MLRNVTDTETAIEDEVRTLLRQANRLEAENRRMDAIELLVAANRQAPDTRVEVKLARLRFDAFEEMDRPIGFAEWPPEPEPIERDMSGVIAETTVPELTTDAVRRGILGHGALLVRGLLKPPRVAELVEGVDRAFEARENRGERPTKSDGLSPWYQPIAVPVELRQRLGRAWVGHGGGLLTADSPHNLFVLLEAFREARLHEVISGYLGERPTMSASKCTLRRIPVDSGSGWHQDGSFLGKGVRSLNVWIALSACGIDSPGLDVVPRRFDDLVETGTGGAIFDWVVGPTLIEELGQTTPVVRPVFEPGDALLFDDLFLHRTTIGDGMSRERYAIENWFFAPSVYPERQVPLVW